MSDKFVASNGTEVLRNVDGWLSFGSGGNLSQGSAAALREFFQHERDERMGRWRERPDCIVVVYPYGEDALGNRCVRVLRESLGAVKDVYENNITQDLFGDAARNYFAAHPERKPWHDAKPGEVWLIGVPTGPTFEFSAMTAVEHDGKIAFSNPGSDEWLAPTYEPLSARRIWPEVSDVQ